MPEEAVLHMTQQQVEAYLEDLRVRHRTEETIQNYRTSLGQLYRDLPEGNPLGRETLGWWQGRLLASGYTPRTVNRALSVANSFFAFLGHRELQTSAFLEPPRDVAPPELTRREYLRMLQTARTLGKERTYLLIKLFATTGLTVQQLPCVTVEAVEGGSLSFRQGGKQVAMRIPEPLQEELEDYARRSGVCSGPVFVTRGGTPLSRTNVSDSIRHLCWDARVDERKGNPTCLRRLYLSTVGHIRDSLSILLDQTYQRLLEAEQETIGWGQAENREF